MNTWKEFLDSLAKRGGNILILLGVCGVLFTLLFHVLHHQEANHDVQTVILSTFSAFTGALLNALVSGTSNSSKDDEKKIQ